jgi:hypothetical protein
MGNKLHILGLSILLLGACATHPKGPSWQGKSWEEGGNLYFSGISSETDTIQGVRQEAYNNAIADIADYLGVSLNITSENSINSGFTDYQSVMESENQDVLLKQIHVKNFEYQKSGKKYIGNILLEYNRKIMQEELARKEEARKKAEQEEPLKKEQEKEIRKKRKNIGNIQVKLLPDTLNFKTQLTNHLNGLGYAVTATGKIVLVKAADISCVPANGLWVCVLNLEVNFKNKISVYQAKGVGKDREQSLNNAGREVVKNFPQDFY